MRIVAEAAAYALVDFGSRCVIAPSFGEIFVTNALSNGLLTARVAEGRADALIEALETGLIEPTEERMVAFQARDHATRL